VHESLRQFHPVIARWFEERVGIPTPPQVMGWPVIGAGEQGQSALILAPTGSGKTLAAFLVGIDWLAKRMMADEEGAIRGVQILYISPLKSLANDVQKNLIRPLEEMAEVAAAMNVRDWPQIDVGVRTGDTPQKARAAMLRKPPQILITTPESLNLLLTTGARGALSTARFVIVDEVHALAGSKRGVFLSLLLERLEEDRRRAHGPESGDAKKPGGAKQGRGGRGLKIAPGVYVPQEPLTPLVRIGLSATARPEEDIARWLAGYDDDGNARPIEIIRSGQRKRLDLQVVCPFAIGADEETWRESPKSNGKARESQDKSALESPDGKTRGTGHWPEVTRAILQMIREHKSTLVFGNSRQLVERLAARFEEELAKEGTDADTSQSKIETQKSKMPVILPHHGSIAKEVRLETEQALKRGEVDAVLATSSLELGIDIGSLDLVVQIDSPGNIAAGLQRVGRAGHLEKATAKGRFVVRGSYALPAFAALLPLMFEGTVEETRVPENCLDVLAQQIAAACVAHPWNRGTFFRLARRAMPFRQLSEKQFDSVVEMLSKRAARVTTQGLRPRISFDRVNDELIALPGTAQVVMFNSGVIADTGQYPVYLAGARRGRVELTEMAPRDIQQARWGAGKAVDAEEKTGPGIRLGELDEEFVYETKEGDRIILGSQTWRVVRIDADRVLVEHAAPGSSRMPFWRGESAPRSELLGEAVARFHGEMERRLGASGVHALACRTRGQEEAHADTLERERRAPHAASSSEIENISDWLMREHHFDGQAADNAITYYSRQLSRGSVPTDKKLVIEHFIDRTGEPVIAILNPLGRRVNYTLRLALEGQLARRRLPAQVVHHDDGIIIRPPVEVGEIPANPLAWLKSSRLEDELVDQLEGAALFGLRFRQNAARALMLPKMTLAQRTPLWQQRLRARHLLALVKKQRNFPIIIETYRECLQDVLNIPAVKDLLGKLERGEVAVQIVRNSEGGSPFAQSIFSQFQQAYLYEWDDPLAESRLEPSVDPRVLDDILQRRATAEEKPSAPGRHWDDADEAALWRRIWGLDYPARTAEELLEKMEAAGSVGLPLGFEEDARWRDWAVAGAEEFRQMLAALAEKRRLLLAEWGGKEDLRWIAAENLAPLLAARGKVTLHQLQQGAILKIRPDELPPALLHTNLAPEDARRLLVEQSLKREAVAAAGAVAAQLPWMQKEIAHHLAALRREGLLLDAGEGRIVWAEYAEQLRAMSLRRQRRGAATVDLAALQRHLLAWHRIQSVLPAAPGGPPFSAARRELLPPAPEPLTALDAVEDSLDLLTGLPFPLDMWEHEILPARIPDFAPAILDGICRSGHRVWVGSAEGIGFWPRHLLGDRPAPEEAALSSNAARIRDFLKVHGASFQFDLQVGLALDDGNAALALAELADAGMVSCDQLESLREVLRLAGNARRDRTRSVPPPRLHATHARHVARPSRLPRHWWKGPGAATAGSLGGRWFLLPAPAVPQSALEIAQRAADRADRFLRRTGFACRELAEPIDGTWKDSYDVLTRMEWAGTVRRGYFVDGIAGSQFALPNSDIGVPPMSPAAGAQHSSPITWLSMLDPANIWSRASTRWISDAGLAARVPRSPGNWIALLDGRPVLAATAWGQRLIPLPAPTEEQQAALATVGSLLPRLPRQSHPYLAVRYWDQSDILRSPAEEILHQQGFQRDPQGMRLYRQYAG
jgi:ATP-dependent Lhr-like helicase